MHDAKAAITREKEIEGWRRDKKVALIEERIPTWEDLAGDLFAAYERKSRSLTHKNPGFGMT